MARNRRKVDRTQQLAELGASARSYGAVAARAVAGLALVAGLIHGSRLGWAWLTTSPTFAVASITLDGNRRTSAEELVRLSGLHLGENLFSVDLDAALAAIESQPWVASATGRRVLPRTLQIELVEREPALLVELENLYVADVGGVVFKRLQPGDHLDLPVVTGLERDDYLNRREETEARLRSALELVRAWEGRSFGAQAPLQELALDAAGTTTLVVGREAQSVHLGEPPWADKLDKLEKLWGELKSRNVVAQVIRLDNRSRPDWVAVKLAQLEPSKPAGKPVPKP